MTMENFDEYLDYTPITIDGLEDGFVNSLIDRVKKGLTSTYKDVNKSFGLFNDFLYNLGTINTPKKIRNLRKSFADIEDVPYVNIHLYSTMTLQGLRVPLSEVSEHLLNFFTSLENNKIYKELDKLDTDISMFLSKTDYRKSFSNDNVLIENIREELVNKPKVNMLKAIDSSNKNEYVKVEDLISSNNDFKNTLDLLIEIDDKISDKDILKLNKLINKIYKKIKLLQEKLDSGLEFSKIGLENLISLLGLYSEIMTTISMYFYVYSKIMDVTLELGEVYKR